MLMVSSRSTVYLQAQVLEEMPAFPEKDSTLLAKLKKKDPKQAKIHENKVGVVFEDGNVPETNLPSNAVSNTTPAQPKQILG